METNIPYSANALMEKLNIKSKETLRNTYLNPSIENGLIEMTLPDKPNSKNQKYIKKINIAHLKIKILLTYLDKNCSV